MADAMLDYAVTLWSHDHGLAASALVPKVCDTCYQCKCRIPTVALTPPTSMHIKMVWPGVLCTMMCQPPQQPAAAAAATTFNTQFSKTDEKATPREACKAGCTSDKGNPVGQEWPHMMTGRCRCDCRHPHGVC